MILLQITAATAQWSSVRLSIGILGIRLRPLSESVQCSLGKNVHLNRPCKRQICRHQNETNAIFIPSIQEKDNSFDTKNFYCV